MGPTACFWPEVNFPTDQRPGQTGVVGLRLRMRSVSWAQTLTALALALDQTDTDSETNFSSLLCAYTIHLPFSAAQEPVEIRPVLRVMARVGADERAKV